MGFYPVYLVGLDVGFYPVYLVDLDVGFYPVYLVDLDVGFYPVYLVDLDVGFYPVYLVDLDVGFYPVYCSRIFRLVLSVECKFTATVSEMVWICFYRNNTCDLDVGFLSALSIHSRLWTVGFYPVYLVDLWWRVGVFYPVSSTILSDKWIWILALHWLFLRNSHSQ